MTAQLFDFFPDVRNGDQMFDPDYPATMMEQSIPARHALLTVSLFLENYYDDNPSDYLGDFLDQIAIEVASPTLGTRNPDCMQLWLQNIVDIEKPLDLKKIEVNGTHAFQAMIAMLKSYAEALESADVYALLDKLQGDPESTSTDADITHHWARCWELGIQAVQLDMILTYPYREGKYKDAYRLHDPAVKCDDEIEISSPQAGIQMLMRKLETAPESLTPDERKNTQKILETFFAPLFSPATSSVIRDSLEKWMKHMLKAKKPTEKIN